MFFISLFVDDDRVTLKLVQGILEGAGYSVVAVADPREALEKMDREQVDLVITDANMPGGVSGFDVVRTIRTRPHLRNLPVALLTGRREKKDIQLGLQVGADDYIIKPIDPLVLLGKVETLLKKRTGGAVTQVQTERTVDLSASWDVDTKITHVSDRGLTLWSCLSAPVDSKVKITSAFFQQLSIDPPILRVIGFSKDPNHPQMYFINTIYAGISLPDLQKIKAWLSGGTTKAS